MQGWSRGVAGFLYLLAMVYSFMGVRIIADKFMEAIEVITSKEKVNRLKENTHRVVCVRADSAIDVFMSKKTGEMRRDE